MARTVDKICVAKQVQRHERTEWRTNTQLTMLMSSSGVLVKGSAKVGMATREMILSIVYSDTLRVFERN